MRRFTRYAIGGILVLALSSAARAQQRDLEVTMDVVPANASEAGAANEIRLPIALPATASPRGQESSAFGQETANAARETARELGREFGRAQSERARAQDRHPKGGPKAP
jgi:predicted flavoprotein YhiN